VYLGINDLATMYPHIAKEWHPTKNGNLQATDVSYSSTKKVWWQCEHGHEWQAVIQERTRQDRGSKCPYCSHHGMSYKELTVLYYLQKYANCEVLHRCKLFGFEFDIHIPSLKVCIEYDGAYYHKDRQSRDLQKNKITNDNQIILYRIRENPLTSLNSTSHDLLYNPQNLNELSHVITYLIKTLFDKNVTIDLN
jgi:hypothetical protein